LRPAICAYSFREELKSGAMKYEDLVHMAVELAIDGLDLTTYWFPNTSDSFLLPLRRLAYRNAVEIYSISIRTEMTQAKSDDRVKEAAAIRGWIDVAEKLGAGHVRVFGGSVPEGATEEQAIEWVTDVLRSVAEYAGSKGVILGLENHGGITQRAERIVGIVRKVDSPWVAINLDSGNFESDVERQMEMCLPYAVNLQMKVEVKGPDGKKVRQDWPAIMALVRKSGYKGYVALEYESEEDARTAFPRYMKELNALLRA
jgi:sugar phosphate isomerase/epimerase